MTVNDWQKRIICALKVGLVTAFVIFTLMLAPYAFVSLPMTDAQIDHTYEVAGWWAFAGFGFQFIRVLVFKKSKT
jgi:hypothetical protein